jgi:ribosomal protein L9
MNTNKNEKKRNTYSTGFEVRRKRLKYRATDNTQIYLTQTIRKVANVLSLTTPIQVHKHSMEMM